MKFPSCKKCERDATFFIPDDLCNRHWAEWWTEDCADTVSPEEREAIIQEILSMQENPEDEEEDEDTHD